MAFNGVLIDDKELKELQEGLERFPKDIPIVTTRAINYAVGKVRTESWKAVKERYNVKQKAFYDSMTLVKANYSNLSGGIIIEAPHTPIGKFQLKDNASNVSAVGPRAETTFSIIKGSTETIQGAFVATMPSGHTGLFMRVPGTEMDGKKKEQIRELFTIGAKEEIDQSDVHGKIDEAGINAFNYEFGRQADLVLLRKT